MSTVSSLTSPAFADKMIALLGMDVSARPPWFVASSGLDLAIKQVTNGELDLATNALEMPASAMEIRPLPKPVSTFTPRTELGRRLWEIRMLGIASGELEPLLDWEGVQKEVADRRGERG